MKLRGINFGPVLDAAGVRGFFGEGYRHHEFLGPLGPNFAGSTFVAKTTTLEARRGNMPMREDGITAKEWFPKCIFPNFRPGNIALSWKMFLGGYMLNAVGLSGPGAEALFKTKRWQERKTPFFVSFMSVKKNRNERLAELEEFVGMFKTNLPNFQGPVGLQMNYSCPNAGINPDTLVEEVTDGLEIVASLGISLMPKFNVLAPVRAVKEICDHPSCDAICVSNTIPWGSLSEKIDWKKLFGSNTSPLAEFGNGGLSGKPLLSLVIDWVERARAEGITKPINAGGGILSPGDLNPLCCIANSIFIGAAASLRPWRVRQIILKAHEVFAP